MRTFLAKLWAVVLLTLTLGALRPDTGVFASDDEYLLALQEEFLNSTQASCHPNNESTGVDCWNIVVRELNVFGKPILVLANLSRVFDEATSEFFTRGLVFVRSFDFANTPVMDFVFNSTTPNGTVISEGSTPLGTLAVPLNQVALPTVPVAVEVAHVARLIRGGETAGIPSFGSGSCPQESFCDSGSIEGTISIFANGAVNIPSLSVSVNVSEPDSTRFTSPFASLVNQTTFCDWMQVDSQAQRNIELGLRVCIASIPCVAEQFSFPVSNDNRTIENALCFARS